MTAECQPKCLFTSYGFEINLHFLVLGTPGEPVIITSEEDIFEYIGYPYKKPNERN
jgi:hypothetical protein